MCLLCLVIWLFLFYFIFNQIFHNKLKEIDKKNQRQRNLYTVTMITVDTTNVRNTEHKK